MRADEQEPDIRRESPDESAIDDEVYAQNHL